MNAIKFYRIENFFYRNGMELFAKIIRGRFLPV